MKQNSIGIVGIVHSLLFLHGDRYSLKVTAVMGFGEKDKYIRKMLNTNESFNVQMRDELLNRDIYLRRS
jgi:hypothetical protein